MNDPDQLSQRLTVNYALIQSVSSMAYCCIMNFAAVFLLSQDFSNSEVGLTLTFGNGLSLVCQPLIAAFADKTQRLALRQIVAALLFIALLLTLMLVFTPAIVLPTAILYILLICAFNSQGSLITAMSMEHINAGIPINFSLPVALALLLLPSLRLFWEI